jgi:hypothetical protein
MVTLHTLVLYSTIPTYHSYASQFFETRIYYFRISLKVCRYIHNNMIIVPIYDRNNTLAAGGETHPVAHDSLSRFGLSLFSSLKNLLPFAP